MKDFIASYFSFTKKERNGIIALLIIILTIILLPCTYSFFSTQRLSDSRQLEKEIAALQIEKADTSKNYIKRNYNRNSYQYGYKYSEKDYTAPLPGELFYFNPNTLSADGWKRLGIKEKTIQTIQKYLSKGGRFYKPEDIEKIWGLRMDEKERLQPYIQIEQNKTADNFENKKYEKLTYAPAIININTADTTALIALPGIGSKLAQRIISFREKLGGFYKAEQVAETFGLPDSAYQKIKDRLSINTVLVKQININTANIDELKIHPYIRYSIGNIIIQYRNQHGNFTAVEDLKKIMLINDEIYNKIYRYLKTSD